MQALWRCFSAWMLALGLMGALTPAGAEESACLIGSAPVQALAACMAERGRDADGLRVERWTLNSAQAGHWILSLGLPDALQLRVERLPASGPPELLMRQTLQSRFAERALPDRRLALPLDLTAGTTVLELHYRVHGDGRFAPRLYTPQAWSAAGTRADLLNGWLAGVLLMLGAIVLVHRWTGGPSSNLRYALLIALEIVSMGQVDGYGFALLWPDAPGWNNHAPTLLCVIGIAMHAAFAMRFLQLRERYPGLWRLNLGWILLVPLGSALLLFAWGDTPQGLRQAEGFGIGMSLAYAPLAVWCAWRAARDGVPGARLYVLGVLALALFTFVLFPLAVLGWEPLPGLELVTYAKLGLLAEAALFSAALVNRVRRFQAEQAEGRMRRLVEAEELLRAETDKRAALERSRAQSLQLASASHDISQPLASLRFAIAALREREPGAGEISAHLDRSLSYAETLLRDIIEQARAELPEHEDHIELGALFAQLTAAWRDQAEAKGLQIGYADTGLELDASTLIVSRLLNNLLSNALRYTERGRILLGVRRRPGGLELQVLDTGPGLLPAQIERLTRAFERGASDSQGFGLGLFIVRSLCAQCGYELRVRSTLGRGTCVGIYVSTPFVN